MITRVFMSWSDALLPAAAQFLSKNHETGAAFGGDLVVVTSGGRGGRLLLATLAEEAARSRRRWNPPQTATPGELAAVLASPGAVPVATSAEVGWAWLGALRDSAAADDLVCLTAASPDSDDLAGWFELARRLDGLIDELATAGLTCADVPARAAALERWPDAGRFEAVARLTDRMHAALSAAGLVHPVTSLKALAATGPLRDDISGVLLVGVPELPEPARQLLLRHAGAGAAINALIHAPAEHASRFDEMGLLRPEAWADVPVIIDDDRHTIVSATDADDQAQRVLWAIDSLDGAWASDTITIGGLDRDVMNALERAAASAQLPLHRADGHDASATAPARLLDAAAEWLEREDRTTLRALLSLPDFEAKVMAEGDDDALMAMDEWWRGTFCDDVNFAARSEARGPLGKSSRVLAALREQVDSLLQGFREPPRRLGAWAEPVLSLLGEVFAECGESTEAACFAVRDILQNEARVQARLAPPIDAATALRLIGRQLRERRIPDSTPAGAVEAVGWLEVPSDPAPILILAGVNEGALPRRQPVEPLLPDGLRTLLGLVDRAGYEARDRYALSAALASRARVFLVVGRTTASGDPLRPSRLLLEGDDELMLRRVADLLAEPETDGAAPAPFGAPACGVQNTFVRPPLGELSDVTRMRVTDFKGYLDCPYRFALKRRLHLKAVEPEFPELGPLEFGSLAHDVLEAWGNGTAASSSRANDIAAALHSELDSMVRDRFGAAPLAAIRIQVDRLRHRLGVFAEVQAQLVSEGWRIFALEQDLAPRGSDPARLDLGDGRSLVISGRIDRIDRHQETGRYRIIDYKTSASADSPTKTHLGREASNIPDADDEALVWSDLQLPLYRHLAPQRWPDLVNAEVGYILLPKDVRETRWCAAEWSSAHDVHAVRTAVDIVHRIERDEHPLNRDSTSPFDPFLRLCQLGVLGGEDDE